MIFGIEEGRDMEAENDVLELSIKALKPSDPRGDEPDFAAAKRAEVDGFIKRGVWRIVKASDVADDANILGGRCISTLKNVGQPEEKAKVRYVAQGQKDADKPFIAHDSSSMRAWSVRAILS